MIDKKKVYFSIDGWIRYRENLEVTASTDKVYDDDIVYFVPEDEIFGYSHGGWLVHIKKKD